jgi:hypothetical protein
MASPAQQRTYAGGGKRQQQAQVISVDIADPRI